MTVPGQALLLVLAAAIASALPAADDFAAAERDLPALRRALDYTALVQRFGKLAESERDPVLRSSAAARAASLALESALLERLAPLESLRSRAAADVARDLALLPLRPAELVTLAEFAFFNGLRAEGEAALARARDGDESLAATTDALLAEARGEKIPRGGYHRYRGEWLPLERRDAAAACDAAIDALRALDPPGLAWPFEPDRTGARSNVGAFEKNGGSAFLRGAARRVAETLAAECAPIRTLLPSLAAQPSLREALLEKRRAMEEPRRRALELIARYDKPDQPAVDANRAHLERLDAEYRALRATDLRPLERLSPARAHAILERLRAGEDALAAAHAYLESHDPPGLEPPEIGDAAPGVLTPRRLLPGREWSPLEDVLFLTLAFRAGRTADVLARADELLRRANEMTPWERMIAEDLRADAVDAFNDRRVATSLDAAELRFVAALNAYRRALGLRPLEIDERLVVASRKHSQEMADLGYFAHVSPVARNRTPGDRARLEGFSGGVGENCLAGRSDGDGAFEAWYRSPGHHRNLVSSGPQLGVGATPDHGMWTMLAGGNDLGWRALHPDVAPERAARIDAAVAALAAAIAKGAPDSAKLRAEVESLLPGALPALARVAFSAASDAKSPARPAHAELLSLVVELPSEPAWRPLRTAAVAAAIEALALDGPREPRARLIDVVKRHAGTALDYDPAAEPAKRRASAEAIRRIWQDEASLVAFGATPPAAPRWPELVGRAGDAPTLEAPRKILTKKDRLDLARRNGGSAETEQAVERGLAFLASVQDGDGGWRARSFPATAPGAWKALKEAPGAGNAEWEVAMTGLALLAFVTAGNSTTQGPHAKAVERGARFLLERIVDYGRFECTSSHYMYSHAIATQALCELYAVTAEARIGAGAQLATDFLVFAQHGPSGGWRYEANEPADTSVTGWVILALNAAAKAGLDASGFHGARRFLDSVTEPAYYRVGYERANDGGADRNRLGAVAMTGRLFIGAKKSDPRVLLAAERIRNDLPRRGAEDFYYWYYATLGLFQLGGDLWTEWNAALAPALLASQNAVRGSPLYGSWGPDREYGPAGGRLLSTSLGVLMLTTYYRYDRDLKPRVTTFTGDVGAKVDPYLEVIRSEPDPMARTIAARKAIDRFGSAMAPVLVARLRGGVESDERVREDFAILLLQCAAPEHEGALLELLADPACAAFAETLVRALEGVSGRRSVPALVARLDDGNAVVRRYAAGALGRIGEPTASAALARRLASEDDGGVKAAIEGALRRLANRESVAVVLDEALSPESAGRLRTLAALDVLESGGAGKILLGMKSSEPALYRRAIETIREEESAALVPVLLVMMESREFDARNEAQKLLRALTRQDLAFAPQAPEEERAAALARWREWWEAHRREYRAAVTDSKAE